MGPTETIVIAEGATCHGRWTHRAPTRAELVAIGETDLRGAF